MNVEMKDKEKTNQLSLNLVE